MSNGSGVSLSAVEKVDGIVVPGSAWRVRWREIVSVDGVEKSKQREKVFHHPEGSRSRTAPELAQKFQAEVLAAIGAREVVDLAPAVRAVPTVATFDAVVRGWLKHKHARGVADGTREKYGKDLKRFTATVREALKLAADAPIPVDLLTRDLFADCVIAWKRADLSESTRYTTARTALDAWTWGADQPATYPGIPAPPRDKSAVLPQAPIYSAGPAPTLEEIDAVIRRLATFAYVARGSAIVMRYTGLRISQALALARADLDEEALTITVRTGKSRREKSTHRVIPVSVHMIAELRPYMGAEDGPLIRRRRDLRAANNRNHHPTGAITDAYRAAVAAGESRLEVWHPTNRDIARPDHAFRAALQEHFVEKGVRDEVIDAIVGHAGKTTRSRHYSGDAARFGAAREAVDALPAIDWTGPEKRADNVVPMTRGA